MLGAVMVLSASSALLMFALVMAQPNFGGTITLGIVLMALLWFAGAPKRLFAALLLGAGSCACPPRGSRHHATRHEANGGVGEPIVVRSCRPASVAAGGRPGSAHRPGDAGSGSQRFASTKRIRSRVSGPLTPPRADVVPGDHREERVMSEVDRRA
ncbi:hypothetical protein GCM10027258_49160 [Amycolatopsis stemonae]